MTKDKKGTVYWITGLSGAGKTTIGLELLKILNTKNNVIFLDGDELREIYGDDIGYSIDDRLKMAMRNSRLCKMLSNQGFDVICCTISMFHNIREWNRKNIHTYKEIYLKVSKEVLIDRDQKKLYSQHKSGKVKNIMGIDLKFEEPLNPDIVIQNDGIYTPEQIVSIIKNSL